MNRQIIVNNTYGEKRIAILEDRKLVELHVIHSDESSCLSNIYSGIVRRVLPGMQSAFVEFGGARTGFIHANDLKVNITYEEYQKNIESDDDDPAIDNQTSETQNESRKFTDITEYAKEGNRILVQVVKEPIGQKGAKLTTHISLAGRYCVLLPTISHIGVSKKINDREKRDELREFGQKVLNKGYGIILRTLAAETDLKTIEKEVVFLIKKWISIQNTFQKGKGTALIEAALDPMLDFVQNTGMDELSEIVVDNKNDEKAVRDYFAFYGENPDDKVKFYDLPYPIFDYYSIEPEVTKLVKKKIWLKSGGFLIIEQTEALTVIDVNTGKFVGKGDLESTVVKTNCEAAEEIAYHLRLRNLAGIIVVDFIDMRNQVNKKKVITKLEKELEKDPAKCTVFYFTRLGLIQITRKRTTESNISSLTEPCPYCSGNGIIRSRETLTFQIFREIKKHVKLYNSKVLTVKAHPETIFALEQKYSEELEKLKKELKISVNTESDNTLHRESFAVDGK
jgi:ribonuclease G